MGVTLYAALAPADDFASRAWLDAKAGAWETFQKGPLGDLADLVLAASGWAVLLLALARALVLVPWPRRWVMRSDRHRRRRLNVLGGLLLLGSAIAAPLTLPGDVREDSADGFGLTVFLLCSAAAAGVLAYALANRLRMTITVDGTDGAGATEIIALLRELGAERPEGIEAPRGTDVNILQGKAIAEAPTGVLAAVLNVVQAVVGFVPWAFTVDKRDDQTFVIATRNGRSWDSAVIPAEPFGPTGPTVDGRRMAAAFILIALSRGYAPRDFAGLAGTHDWRALGWQYVAASDQTLTESDKRMLLRKALDEDPDSFLVRHAFMHQLYRKATEVGEIAAYLDWLEPNSELPGIPPGLRLRISYNRLAMACNLLAANAFKVPDTDTVTPSANDRVSRAALHLAVMLRASGDTELKTRMRIQAGSLIKYGGATLESTDDPSADALVEYCQICVDAVTEGPSKQLVDQLTSNLQDPESIDWARKDPMLKRVAASEEFQRAFPT